MNTSRRTAICLLSLIRKVLAKLPFQVFLPGPVMMLRPALPNRIASAEGKLPSEVGIDQMAADVIAVGAVAPQVFGIQQGGVQRLPHAIEPLGPAVQQVFHEHAGARPLQRPCPKGW